MNSATTTPYHILSVDTIALSIHPPFCSTPPSNASSDHLSMIRTIYYLFWPLNNPPLVWRTASCFAVCKIQFWGDRIESFCVLWFVWYVVAPTYSRDATRNAMCEHMRYLGTYRKFQRSCCCLYRISIGETLLVADMAPIMSACDDHGKVRNATRGVSATL